MSGFTAEMSGFMVSVATEQGSRDHQEDRYVVQDTGNGLLLAVMDGHCGHEVSQLMANYLPEIWDQLMLKPLRYDAALRELVSDLDYMTHDFEKGGSTLSVVFITDDAEPLANIAVVGDSPVIVKDPDSRLTVSPSHNVRISRAEMQKAIERGGCDVGDGYVRLQPMGPGLQMARALGDGELGPVISKEPDVYEGTVGEYLLIATDGVFGSDNRDFGRQLTRVITKLEFGDDAFDLVKQPTEDNATAIVVRRKTSGAASVQLRTSVEAGPARASTLRDTPLSIGAAA